MGSRAVSSDVVRSTLEKVLASSLFQGASRSRALLKFIVEEHAAGRLNRLKEYTIGAEALGRGDSFDPRTDTIVRAEASRLRARLERYYATEGRNDPITIALPKGSYVPEFLDRNATPLDAAPAPGLPAKIHLGDRKMLWIAAGAFIALTALAIAVWGPQYWKHSPRPQVMQFDVELKGAGTVHSEVGTDVVLSPDASRLVFVTLDADGASHLNTRRLDDSQITELPGTQGARNPFFSPDGDWVAFWADGKLMKTPVQGGSPVTLCDATDELGGTWSGDGTIIASLGENRLWRIPAAGGTPSVVLDLSNERSLPLWPQTLPNGEVLFTNIGFSGPNGATVEALSLRNGKRTVLARGGTFGRYLHNGFLAYVNQGTLYAVPLDVDQLKVQGTSRPVLEHVSYSLTFGYAQLSFSDTGTLVYRKASDAETIAVLADSSGRTEPFMASTGHYLWPRISPNGKRLAFSLTENGVSTLAVYDGSIGTVRLPVPGGVHMPLWTRDGRFLVVGGLDGLSWIRPDGSAKPVPLLTGGATQIPWSISSDGHRLAFHQLNPTTGFDLWTVPIQVRETGLTAGTPEPFLQTPAYETYPSFSPDGKWVSYASNTSGSWQVYVSDFPNHTGTVQVSKNGGRISFWSPNRHEILYRTDDQQIWVATYRSQRGTFIVDSVKPWPRVRLADTGVLANLDLAPDGKHFLLLTPAENPDTQQSQNHVTFMLDFFGELKQWAPTATQ
jgi:serine/threonine-protein kinase